MDLGQWPGWVFSGLVGILVALLTRSAAVKAAVINSQAAPYEAMAKRLERVEEERDEAVEKLRSRELEWTHERAQIVTSMGVTAHELFQLKALMAQHPEIATQAHPYGSE